ncbi:MAG: prepilin-type N-terminal cleavage/methylation domain-containing protein [candidate division WOR-3 bacterium]|nr:prepilin-type N-terminal cleavage/methylation domain-containing protein [candidate division WOR-3 bacterium]
MKETGRKYLTNGMTLIELMVSLVILMLVLGAVYSIMNIQQNRATQLSKTTILQTDAQVAFTLMKWDLLLAGLGYPYSKQDAVQLLNVGGVDGAGVGLRAVGLGFEINRIHWSYLVDDAKGVQFLVRRWSDTAACFSRFDTIVILNEMREPIYSNLVVTNDPRTDTTLYIDSLWGDSIPASRINVGVPISARQGLMVFSMRGNTYTGGINYRVFGDTLMRGSEPLLTNVEAIAVRYGIDTDGDRVIDTWTNRINPPFNPGYGRTWALRFTMVVVSDPISGYRYPENFVTIENNPPYTYPLNALQRQRKRVFLSSIVYPQNLQP